MDAPENSLGSRLFALGIGSYIAFLPSNWLTLGNVGGLEVRLSHLATAILVTAFFVLRWHGSIAIIKDPWIRRFTFAFVCYLIVLWTSTFTGTFRGEGFALIFKQAIFLFIFLVTAELMTNAPIGERAVARVIYISSAIGVVIFIAIAAIIFAKQGKNLAYEFVSAIARGDTQMLRFGMYRTLFSAQMDASDVNVSFRNGLCGAFCAIYFMLLAFSQPALNSASTRLMWALKWFGLLSCALIVVSSLSRSNILVLFLGSCLGFVPQIKSLSSRFLIVPMLLLPPVIVGLFFAADKVLESADEFVQRFEKMADDARLDMFQVAISEIGRSNNWWIGAGVGSKINFGINELQIHNLFLASWYEAGIPALCCAVTFYFILVFIWCSLLFRYRDNWWPFECSPVWLASLLTLPLVRMMVGGQGGNMSVNDWFSVSIVMALVAAARAMKDYQPDDVVIEADEDDESELDPRGGSDLGNREGPEEYA